MPATRRLLQTCSIALLVAACGDMARLPDQADTGPAPALAEPKPTKFLPTVKIAPAQGWPDGMTPTAAPGMAVNAFASGFDHPRWIYVLPNGDVLVAETNRPAKKPSGLRAWIMSKVQKRAGAAIASADRVTLVRDADGDGITEFKTTFLDGLKSPFGIALIGDQLYVANTDAIVRFPYQTGATRITAPGTKVADLPAGTINHHWTKNILASPDGKVLYTTVGSNSNVAENGMENEVNRAAVLEIQVASGKTRLFASGLRNPNGLGWHPQSRVLWTVVNERDELGSDLVPDYLTSLRDGGFYGWPYSYYGEHVDHRVRPPRPDLVATAIVPDYALGSHVAPLGLAFYDGDLLPQRYAGGAFIGLHGSWNRKPLAGYKVVFVPFSGGKPAGRMEDVLTGFVSPEGNAYGRPVGVAVDRTGAILVADDVGNTIWRVSPARAKARAARRQPLADSTTQWLIPVG